MYAIPSSEKSECCLSLHTEEFPQSIALFPVVMGYPDFGAEIDPPASLNELMIEQGIFISNWTYRFIEFLGLYGSPPVGNVCGRYIVDVPSFSLAG